jgi:hypothetical protein
VEQQRFETENAEQLLSGISPTFLFLLVADQQVPNYSRLPLDHLHATGQADRKD